MSLSELLEQKHISKYRLSKESGVPQATISDICTGKTKIQKCSAETIYRIAKALSVSMESLVEPVVIEADEEKNRMSFDLFKSTVCHRLKALGDIEFIIALLESNQIRILFDKGWYPESLYLLAMLDYLSRENNVPICDEYDDIRCHKLHRMIFPTDVLLLSKLSHSDEPKQEAIRKSIPEFLQYNIVEGNIRDVI